MPGKLASLVKRKEYDMTKEFLEQLLENLEETPFPIQISWFNKELYLKGLDMALNKTLKDNGYVIVPKIAEEE